jgi:methionyl-tRNA formyltransferase
MMKVGLYLMNQKGLSILKTLLDSGYLNEIGYVVSSKDKGLMDDSYSDIIQLCEKNGIAYCNRNRNLEELPSVEYKLAIGWRWLIKEHENLIVLHDSILPRYRGFAPLVNSLINGEQEIGVTALWANKEYDKGDIIAQRKIQISYPQKIHEAIQRVSGLYNDIVLEIFKAIRIKEPLVSEPQEEAKASYSIWRNEDDYTVDWTQSSENIQRFVDAVGFPYKGAQSETTDGELIYIDEVSVLKDLPLELRHPGKVIKFNEGKPVVICGQGLIQLDKIRGYDGEEIQLTKFRTRFK